MNYDGHNQSNSRFIVEELRGKEVLFSMQEQLGE